MANKESWEILDQSAEYRFDDGLLILEFKNAGHGGAPCSIVRWAIPCADIVAHTSFTKRLERVEKALETIARYGHFISRSGEMTMADLGFGPAPMERGDGG